MANEFGDQLPRDCQVIEVHVGELNQLFNAMDPAPFRERDLDPNAEAFIVESAKELRHHERPIGLLVYVDREAVTDEGQRRKRSRAPVFCQPRPRDATAVA